MLSLRLLVIISVYVRNTSFTVNVYKKNQDLKSPNLVFVIIEQKVIKAFSVT